MPTRVPQEPPDLGLADKERDVFLFPGWGPQHAPHVPGRWEEAPHRQYQLMHLSQRDAVFPASLRRGLPCKALKAPGEPKGGGAPRTPHRAPGEAVAGSLGASLGAKTSGGQ